MLWIEERQASMAPKGFDAEQIVSKLREADVLMGQRLTTCTC